MTRGTTPYHSFVISLSSSEIEEIYITYLQNNEIILEKTGNDVHLEDIEIDTSNGFITDENKGDSFSSNDAEQEQEERQDISYCQATVHLSQEDTLAFKFYPAAEKNIAVIQIRVITTNGEAYASLPVKERIFGVLKDGVIPDGSEK